MKKLLKAFLAVAMALTAVSASAADKKLKVGFVQIDNNQGWRTAETDSFKNEAAANNIDLKYVDAQDSQANQIKALKAFIAQGVDAIVLPPKVETGWEPVLKEAKAAKIPVFLVDRGLKTNDPSLYVTLLASDFVFEGEEAASGSPRRPTARPTSSSCRAPPAPPRPSTARRGSRPASRPTRT